MSNKQIYDSIRKKTSTMKKGSKSENKVGLNVYILR